jgi:hypothetical protein
VIPAKQPLFVAATIMQPLFSEKEEDDWDDCCSSADSQQNAPFLNKPNKQTSSAFFRPYAVDSTFIDGFSESAFRDTYRGKRPVLLKGGALKWGIVRSWNSERETSEPNKESQSIASEADDVSPTKLRKIASIKMMQRDIDDRESELLLAHDNRNFLKKELCESVQGGSTHEFINMIFKHEYDNRVGGRLEFSKNQEPLSSNPARLMYCREYLHNHPKLLPGIDFRDLEQLAFGANATGQGFKTSNVGLWMSTEGCVTPLHFDLCHGFLSQIVGRKTFLLAPPVDTNYMYWPMKMPNREFTKLSTAPNNPRDGNTWPSEQRAANAISPLLRQDTANTSSSMVDLVEWMNCAQYRSQYPLLENVSWCRAELEPGDILYTPPGWWHHVTSESNSASVLLPFDPVLRGSNQIDILPSNITTLTC